MIRLTETKDGVVLPVKARPSGKINAILGEHDGALKVVVTAAPDKGKANDAIVDLLADGLGIRRSDITLVRGATDQRKQFLITGIDRARLQEALGRIVDRH